MKKHKFYNVFIICIIIITLFLFSFGFGTTASSDFIVFDTNESINYHITQKDNVLHCESGSESFDIYMPDEVINIKCYNSVFNILCVTETSPNIFHYTIRTYNAENDNSNAIATNIIATRNQSEFYTDNEGVFYIIDNMDDRTIHIITDTQSSTITSPAVIYQLLYTENKDFLVFSAQGTYLLKNDTLSFLSKTLPATPCTYSGNYTITDSQNRKYTYRNNCFSEYIENTKAQLTEVISTDSIKSPTTEQIVITTTQFINIITTTSSVENTTSPQITKPDNTPDNSFILFGEKAIRVPQNTTFAKLYKYLNISKSELVITKQNGEKITSGKLGTGMTASFSDKTYTIIINGELTGEGNINSRDLKTLMKHLTDELHLEEPFKSAADINSDNKIDTKDLLALSRIY